MVKAQGHQISGYPRFNRGIFGEDKKSSEGSHRRLISMQNKTT